MSPIDERRILLEQRADLNARRALIPFDGSIEVKDRNGKRFLYARSRVAGKNTSTYLDVYSDELYGLLQRQAIELRAIKRQLRAIDKQLALLGYTQEKLSPNVLLNIDFARSRMKTLIYDQAILEGVSTTFPQTEEIIDNGIVNGMKASDVQKILNLKHAWEFVLDKSTIECPTDLALLCHIAKLVNEGFFEYGGHLRSVPVVIGGTGYVPPIPQEASVKEALETIVSQNEPPVDVAIELALYCIKTQTFIDGNKRTAFIFANQYLIGKGSGTLIVPESKVGKFKPLLIDYYEDGSRSAVKQFLRTECWQSMK